MYCKNCGNKISEGAKFCKSWAYARRWNRRKTGKRNRPGRESICGGAKRRKISAGVPPLSYVCACVTNFCICKTQLIDRKTTQTEDGKLAAPPWQKGETEILFANLANGGNWLRADLLDLLFQRAGQGIYKTAICLEEGRNCENTVPGNLNAAGRVDLLIISAQKEQSITM